MQLIKQCDNCEFNSDGFCCGGDSLYGYGNEITDLSKCCEEWEPNLDCFSYQINKAPRFLREAFNDCSISYSDFSNAIDNYIAGKDVKINIFDAIKEIYGISMVDIAIVLNVSFGVVYRAKSKGFAPKRLNQFSKGLFLEPDILLNTSTADFNNIKEASEIFWKQNNISKTLVELPEWKLDLAYTISSYIKCPIHLAKNFARVDKMYWTSEMELSDFTQSEKELINYIVKHCQEDKRVYKIKYFLDISGRPHLNISMIDKNK